MTGLVVVVVSWWLMLGAAMTLTLPEPAASATPLALVVMPGQLAHIHQPGMPSWPVPVEREAFDEAHQRGFRESDEAALNRAFAGYEWIGVSHGQAVSIVAVDAEAVQVELLEGPQRGRRAWVQPRHLGSLPSAPFLKGGR